MTSLFHNMASLKYLVQMAAFFSPAVIKKILFRMIGFKIGKKVRIGPFSLILVNHMRLDDNATIDPFTLVIQLKHFHLGEKARIAAFSKIFGKGAFIAKQRSLVSTQCLVECTESTSVILGDYSCLGPRNTVYTHGKFLPLLQGYPFRLGNVTLGDYVWTGMASTISPGTTIGNNTITTPMANLFGQIPGNSFVKATRPEIETRNIRSYLKEANLRKKMAYIKALISDIACGLKDISFKYNFVPLEKIDCGTVEKNIDFGGIRIKFVESREDIGTTADGGLYVGYDLPEEIKGEEKCLWLDFMDYTHSNRSDRAQNLFVQRLHDRTGLKFIARGNKASWRSPE